MSLRKRFFSKKTTETPSPRNVSQTEMEDLRTAFGLLDKNQDGRVNAAEIQLMLRDLGIELRDEVVTELVVQASTSGDGLMDESEFLAWISRIQELTQSNDQGSSHSELDDDLSKDLIAAFRVFDRDCNGFISKDELRTAMEMIGERVTERQLNELLQLADTDHDGRINYEEFTRLLL